MLKHLTYLPPKELSRQHINTEINAIIYVRECRYDFRIGFKSNVHSNALQSVDIHYNMQNDGDYEQRQHGDDVGERYGKESGCGFEWSLPSDIARAQEITLESTFPDFVPDLTNLQKDKTVTEKDNGEWEAEEERKHVLVDVPVEISRTLIHIRSTLFSTTTEVREAEELRERKDKEERKNDTDGPFLSSPRRLLKRETDGLQALNTHAHNQPCWHQVARV